MDFGSLFGSPYSEGRSLTAVGNEWDCAINGVPFRMDRDSDAFKQGMQTISAIREQADNSALPGEQSISREELWRAGQSSWHKGAGQRYRDKQDSDQERFWSSLGVDVWTKDQLSLLHDTAIVTSATSTTPLLVTAGAWIYHAYGATLARSNDGGATWTTLSAALTNVTSITTDGFRIWFVTPGAAYQTNTGTTTLSSWIVQPSAVAGAPTTSGGWDLVAYVDGRLLVTNKQFVAEVSGTATVTFLNPNDGNIGWTWTTITDGVSAIYAAGYAGTRSQIFSIRPPNDDPTAALGPPVPAAPAMPTGEIVRCLYSYLGLLAVGTDKGIRIASKITDYAGREIVSVNALTALPHPVLTMDGEGSYVYFGWTNFDATHTGLGRINLAQAVDNGIYAYASDVMAATNGSVTSTVLVGSSRYFTVSGAGIFHTIASYASSGWLQSGIIRYGLIDEKVAERIELRHASLTGSIGVSLAADGGAFVDLGTSDTAGTVTPNISISAKEIGGVNLELQTTLTASVDGSPVVQHVELRSQVVPNRGDTFLVPVLLEEHDTTYETRRPADDFEMLRSLARSQHQAIYQEKSKLFSVIVQDYQFIRDRTTTDNDWWQGTLILKMMAPAS